MSELHWYVLGLLTVVVPSVVVGWHRARKRYLAEQAFLRTYARMHDVIPLDGESNRDLRERIRDMLMRYR